MADVDQEIYINSETDIHGYSLTTCEKDTIRTIRKWALTKLIIAQYSKLVVLAVVT